MELLHRPSPNQSARPAGTRADLIVIHATAGSSEQADVAWCCNADSRVSYHYIIGRTGLVYQLVEDSRRAWHAGAATWQGRDNCNDYSIGIGLSNRGQGELYPGAQYSALAELVADLRARHSIPWDRVVGHYHVSPGRKTDPWYTFEWMRMVRA